jgi:hypothetical protein
MTFKKITFGIRNWPIAEGFTKYPETRHLEPMTVSRDLHMMSEEGKAINYIKNKRIADVLIGIIRDHPDDNLLILDDDVFLGPLGRTFDFDKQLAELTYIAFPHGKPQQEGIVNCGTDFYLPVNAHDDFIRALASFNETSDDWNIDIWANAHLASRVARQLMFIDGTYHIFSEHRLLTLNVLKGNGMFIIPSTQPYEVEKFRLEGWFTITASDPFPPTLEKPETFHHGEVHLPVPSAQQIPVPSQ